MSKIKAINPKTGAGALKPDLSLIPPSALVHEAAVMSHGASKYGPYNWRDSKVPLRTYIAAMQRHLLAVLDGEDIDPDSGFLHMAHIRSGAGIMIDALELGTMVDDRPRKGAASRLIKAYSKGNPK